MRRLLIIAALLIFAFPLTGQVINTFGPLNGNPNIWTGTNIFNNGATFGPILFAQLSSISTSTTLIYVSDATLGSSPCTGGGTGALAIYINGAWSCNNGGGGGGAVTSVFGRTGAVTAAATDYGTTGIQGDGSTTLSIDALGAAAFFGAGSGAGFIEFEPGGNPEVSIQDSSGDVDIQLHSALDGGLYLGNTAASTYIDIPPSSSTINLHGAVMIPSGSSLTLANLTANSNPLCVPSGTVTNVGCSGGGTITGATTNGGLVVTSTTLGLLTTCSTNQVLQWNGSAWACATISGGGNPQLENCTPDETGNSFYSVTSLTNYFNSSWQFVFNTTTYINCTVYIPTAQTGATVAVDVWSSDSTSGHTASITYADGVINSGTMNTGSLTSASNQTFTTTSTANNRVTLTFNVQSTLSNGSILVVKIGTAPTATAPTANINIYPHFIL